MPLRIIAASLLGLLFFVVLSFFVYLLVIKMLWAWTVPDLFPEAVKQGLVAGSISWWTSVKLAILLTLFSGMLKNRQKKTVVIRREGGQEILEG